MTVADPPAEIETVSDLLERLGDIPPERVRMQPAPGTATIQDVIEVNDRTGRLCELVDGTLVEKAVGYRESALAAAIIVALRAFVDPRNMGIVTAPDGMVRLFPALVRGPDVAFVSWDRIPGRRMPEEPGREGVGTSEVLDRTPSPALPRSTRGRERSRLES